MSESGLTTEQETMAKRISTDKVKESFKKARKGGSTFRKEFVEFISRGSVIDLAVGVAVGGAFTTIVNSLVNDIVMPIVGLILGGVDFTGLMIRVPNFFGTGDAAEIKYGSFIQNVVQFLIIAWVIFMIVKMMNRINRQKDKLKEKKEEARKAAAKEAGAGKAGGSEKVGKKKK